MHIRIRTAGALLAFGLIGSSVANAAVTYTPVFSSSIGAGTETFTADTGAQTTDFLAQFDIPRFNPALGTLTGLSVTVSGGMTALGSVTNSGAGAASSVILSQNSTVTNNPPQNVAGSFGGATITGGSRNGDTFLSFTTSATAGASLGTVASGQTMSGIALNSAFATQTLSQSSGFDPNLIGLGTFGITFATGEFTTTGGSGGNLTNSVATQDQLMLSVTYNYTVGDPPPPPPPSVPEPGSMMLIGTGLIGIAAITRRHRKV